MPDRADVLVIGSDVTPEDCAAFARLADEPQPAIRDLPAPSMLGVQAKWLDRPVIDRAPIWRQA
jgi:hypothetical protein